MSEITGHFIQDLSVSMAASFAKMISDADITNFAEVSGDTNPMHLNDAYAAKTRFGGRIAHSMLSASLISTVIDGEAIVMVPSKVDAS